MEIARSDTNPIIAANLPLRIQSYPAILASRLATNATIAARPKPLDLPDNISKDKIAALKAELTQTEVD